MPFFIKDTEIKIGFLFAAFVAALLCFDVGPQVQLSVLSGILHEGGHVFSLLLLGERPQKICFGLFGLTVLRRNDIKLNYKNEIITAFCGPFVNIAICVCALLFYLNYRDNQVLFSVVAINAALALFNLLPVSGLDGGRILECVLLKRFSVEKSEIILCVTSLVVLIPLTVAGFLTLVKSRYNFSLLLLSVYLLILLVFKGLK